MTLPIILADVQARFNPRRLDGLQLWLAADLGLGSLSDGDPVATWPDQSGNGFDAVQSVSAKKPLYKTNIINSRPIIRADGNDDYMSLIMSLSASDWTFYFVIEPDVVATTFRYLFDAETGRLIMMYCTNVSGRTGYYDGAFRVDAVATGGWQILAFVLDDAGGEIFRDGASIGTDTYSQTAIGDKVAIFSHNDGVASFYSGDCAEIILYDRALAASERRRVEKYLSVKYGIALS